MGFLEGTGADSSPEGIASRGFARAWLGMALREMWVRMEGPVLCSCRAEWLPASAWAIFSCTEIKIQINCPESSGCPDVPGMELVTKAQQSLYYGDLRSWVAASALLFSGLHT